MTSITIERTRGKDATKGQEISAYTASFGISLGATSLFNALLVVIKETNEQTVLAWMKAAGHHWVTQGVLDVIVFVALGFLLVQMGETWRFHPHKVCATAVGGVAIGSLIIALFYLRELF